MPILVKKVEVLDIKKYEVLLAAVDKGSFIKAADDLGYTQSGITYMMNSLEKECGFPILQRSNKGVVLTVEGERLLPSIRRLVDMNHELEEEFDAVKGLATGKVRIGCYPTLACAVMPQIMRIFREQYPKIHLDLVEENSVRILEEWLASGVIDVAFMSCQPERTYEWYPLKRDPYLAVFPQDHPLAQYDVVPAEKMMSESFFMYRSMDGIDPDVARYFKNCHMPIVSTCTSNSDYAVLFMIEQGLGIGMVPEIFWNLCCHKFSTLTTRPMTPEASRDIGLAVKNHRTCTLATMRFIREIQKNIKTGQITL